MQIIFDINVPILGTLILACPKLVRSEFKTARKLNSWFNSVEHVLVFIRFLAPYFAKRF